jgi:hypothetical protein
MYRSMILRDSTETSGESIQTSCLPPEHFHQYKLLYFTVSHSYILFSIDMPLPWYRTHCLTDIEGAGSSSGQELYRLFS